MKTLSTPVSTEKSAAQSGWCELYDFYLKSAITTPWGSVSTLRLCTLPNGFSFFTPQIAPEPTGTQGNAQDYNFWPLKREIVRGSSKFANDKLQIAASNVTSEWATMLTTIDWYDTAVVIRKVPTTVGGVAVVAGDLAAEDCAVIFSGLVDSALINLKTIQFTCSSDLATLARVLPAENMHANCRFNFADDSCTKIRFSTENYAAKTCGSSSTDRLIKCAGLTEDTGANGSYGTELVNAISDGAISASSETLGYTNKLLDEVNASVNMFFLNNHKLLTDDPIQFTATVLPGGITGGVTYYVIRDSSNAFRIATTPGGGRLDITTNGTDVKISTVNNHKGSGVKSGNNGYWKIDDENDWGDVDNAYYQIPDAEQGTANFALKPWIQFDFGSAKSARLWRLKSLDTGQLEQLLRVVQIFSSTNNSTWKHETNYEMPAEGGKFFDVLVPGAQSARYWRICVRSRWAESLFLSMFDEVRAYEGSRNWWQDGQVTFDAATATVALRNVTVPVLESYSGECVVGQLPAAPANGDTFVIQRGCARTFNACCARLNWENYGGFNDLPTQTVIR